MSGYYDYEGTIYVVPGPITSVFGTLPPLSASSSGASSGSTAQVTATTASGVTVQPTSTSSGGLLDNPTILACPHRDRYRKYRCSCSDIPASVEIKK